MRKYEHIFFDLDNTLWDFTANSKLALKQTALDFGILNDSFSFEDFFSFYIELNEKLWKEYRNKNFTKAELVKIRFQKTLDNFNVNDVDPLLMNERYLENMPKQNQLVEGAIETLDYLKSRGYQMHIITNGFKEVQHQKLQNSGLDKYFDKVFISEEIQAPKPDKRIFQHALKSCNARKSKSIMIGDSWDVDIIGARNLGMDQVYYSKNESNIHMDSRSANFEENNEETTYRNSHTHLISKMKELINIL